MAKPIFYYGSLLLSGTISGTAATTDNPIRKLRDGSINLPYEVTADVASIQSGSVTIQMTTARTTDAFILPKCGLLSGHWLHLESMDDLAETNLASVIPSFEITEPTDFLLSGIAGATARKVWRLTITGDQALDAQALVHELQLPIKYQLPDSPQVGVDRTRVRQFTRIPVPGGQPFVKRDGPLLRQTSYQFILASGSDIDGVRNLATALEGGDAFTHTDDLAASYWAELLGNAVAEADEAGVSSVALTVQEVNVES